MILGLWGACEVFVCFLLFVDMEGFPSAVISDIMFMSKALSYSACAVRSAFLTVVSVSVVMADDMRKRSWASLKCEKQAPPTDLARHGLTAV